MKKIKRQLSLLLTTIIFITSFNTVLAATLKVGSRGTEVKQLQMNLNGLAYSSGVADGIYGTNTKNAVKKFQSANGLTADGIAGNQTLSKIKSIVTTLQNDLNSFGYNSGISDGIYGTNTKNAVKKFQYDNGLTVDGIAGNQTLSKIKSIKNSSNKTNNNTSSNTISNYSSTPSNVITYSLKNNGNTYLTSNFKIKEFRCYDGSDEIKIDLKLAALLQDIRNHFGKAVIINSAYRTPAYNKKVGGTSNSYHLQGRAADIKINGVTPKEIARYAESLGVKGIGLYGTFVHVDTRSTKYYWKNNGSNRVYTFY